MLFPTVSSGVSDFAERIVPAAYMAILDWMYEVMVDVEGHANGSVQLIV